VISVLRPSAERLDELEPLWRALYEHHAELARGISPVRPYPETWRRRRATYERWLSADEAVLLLAERDGRAVGYAMVRVGEGPTTWALGERSVTIETLSVLPDERGGGVGHALMNAVEEYAREVGAELLDVGVAHTNDRARRFYEREGFGPFYLEMVRDLRSSAK
jgi:ribosomal protein S18 acetylase RimI-like enzyme